MIMIVVFVIIIIIIMIIISASQGLRRGAGQGLGGALEAELLRPSELHPVSITRFPLRRLSPGAGLLRNPFVHR